MNKIFLYLYPIEEYTKMFLFSNDEIYDNFGIEKPLPILNDCIEKRYRSKGYQIVFVLYPNKKMFGIRPKEKDKIIYTDIAFEDNNAYDENGKEKINFTPKYLSVSTLLSKLGQIDELVLGGYHSTDCVKRVGEEAIILGIDTTVDLDLTDLFFSLYKVKDYFNIDSYNPERYKKYWQQQIIFEGENKDFVEKRFQTLYGSPVYKFYSEEKSKISR